MCKICCLEDDLASSITLLALALHRLKIISVKIQVRFILWKACFFHSNVTLLIPPWNSDFKRLLGLWNSFQSSFANTSFKEAIGVAQRDGERSQSSIAGVAKFPPVCFGEVPFGDTMVFRYGVRIDIY